MHAQSTGLVIARSVAGEDLGSLVLPGMSGYAGRCSLFSSFLSQQVKMFVRMAGTLSEVFAEQLTYTADASLPATMFNTLCYSTIASLSHLASERIFLFAFPVFLSLPFSWIDKNLSYALQLVEGESRF